MRGILPYSKDLQCQWCCWSADNENILNLEVPKGNHPDMNGVIKVATSLSPAVRRIQTLVGDKADIMYELNTYDGVWHALSP